MFPYLVPILVLGTALLVTVGYMLWTGLASLFASRPPPRYRQCGHVWALPTGADPPDSRRHHLVSADGDPH